MLRLVGLTLKLAIFSLAVLLAGQWIRWDGQTLSEHVLTQLHRAESSSTADSLRELTRSLTQDAKNGFQKKQQAPSRGRVSAAAHANASMSAPTDLTDRAATQSAAVTRAPSTSDGEKIPPSERQKLRALIRELNSSR